MPDPLDDVTEDRFLGGHLRLRQPRSGHRVGHDAMLLAASIAADAGDRVVEFGAGVGAAGLALARRVPGIQLVLVEIDPTLAELARGNAVANGIHAQVLGLDVTTDAGVFAAAGLKPDSADVVMMNPPFNDPSRHRSSPDPGRQRAHVADAGTLDAWIHAARRILKSGGVLTLIWRADGLSEVLAAFERGFGSLAVQPVHGDPDAPAIRILVRAVKGGRAPTQVHAGVMLKTTSGQPNGDVEAILSGQGTLVLARR